MTLIAQDRINSSSGMLPRVGIRPPLPLPALLLLYRLLVELMLELEECERREEVEGLDVELRPDTDITLRPESVGSGGLLRGEVGVTGAFVVKEDDFGVVGGFRDERREREATVTLLGGSVYPAERGV